jgi:hypothetical protein
MNNDVGPGNVEQAGDIGLFPQIVFSTARNQHFRGPIRMQRLADPAAQKTGAAGNDYTLILQRIHAANNSICGRSACATRRPFWWITPRGAKSGSAN